MKNPDNLQTKKKSSKKKNDIHCQADRNIIAADGILLPSHEFSSELLNDDQISRAKAFWFFGDWQSLSSISVDLNSCDSDKALLLLLISSAHQQLGKHEEAKELILHALQLGAERHVVAQILFSSIHNTVGRIAELKGDFDKSTKHFEAAVSFFCNKDGTLAAHARSIRELAHFRHIHKGQLVNNLDDKLNPTKKIGSSRHKNFSSPPNCRRQIGPPWQRKAEWAFLEKTHLSRRNPWVPKAAAEDFQGRFCEVLSDPLNQFIERDPHAGQVCDGWVKLHNGHVVAAEGKYAYYGDYAKILVLNRGVHEPLEEFCFQEVIKNLRQSPVMLELGSFWAHYSMWLQKLRPQAELHMVEAEYDNMVSGKRNFEKNGYKGKFIQNFVGHGNFSVDTYLSDNNIKKLDILHSDIQGYELEMLNDSSISLTNKTIDYIFLSTHSQLLHLECINFLENNEYKILVNSDFDNDTTSYDGFILAVNPEKLN